MTEDFIRFKTMDGEVLLSKKSIACIKQQRTKDSPHVVPDSSEKGFSMVDKNYDYLEITLKETDPYGRNIVLNVKLDLETFIHTYLK